MRYLSVVALLGLHASVTFAQGQAYGNIFSVDTASCQPYINNGQLQKIINEAATMAQYGVTMTNDANAGHNYAKAYLRGLFGGVEINTPQSTQIGNTLNAVYNFLGRGTIPPGNPYKPWLFCNDDNFQLINPDIAAVQLDGVPATQDGTNRVSVRNEYAGQIAATRYNGNDPNVYLVKFPATGNQPEIYQYYFLSRKSGDRVCSPGNLGETFEAQVVGASPRGPVAVVVLCPASFSYGYTDILGSIAPVLSATNPTQAVSQLAPYSFTLLHEMMHFCPLNPLTGRFKVKDFIEEGANGQVTLNGYALNDAIQLTIYESITNAQNYAFYSLGSYYTYNRPDANGRYPSYAEGYGTFLQT